ncbi:hypothetical protein QQM79_11195 [Marinobacteraceae bacterium S3BR75-40.1]
MSTATVVLILFVIAAISILVIFVSQAREKARIERIRKITATEDAYRHVHRLIDELPPQYLNKQLRQLILERAIELAEKMRELGSTRNVDSMIQRDQELIQTGLGNDGQQPVKISTPAAAKEIKALLQSLFKLVEAAQKKGKIDTATAKRYLKHIVFLARKTQAEVQAAMAQEQIRNGKARKGALLYQRAIDELSKVRDYEPAQKLILGYREQIRRIDQAIQDEQGKPVAVDKQQEKIENAWDEFIQEEEGWKKKADYDD